MGRKIDMKKIEDVTKCQVTFSKRRSSLMKKANEIAVCCDVDVAFVAFSPSGRVSKFSNQRRIEDVLHRYVNLPAESRLNHITNVQNKMEKLQNLNHIKSDTNKLQYLDKQIENLELQIKKSGLELQILEADLRDYEIDPDQEPSLHQLTWCERNINHSLERVIARKNALFGNPSIPRAKPNIQIDEQMGFANQEGLPLSSNLNENELDLAAQNPSGRQILMNLDPWISPYSARVRESLFQDLVEQTKNVGNMDPGPSSYQNPLILDSGIMGSSHDQLLQQPDLMVNQNLLNFPAEQDDLDAWNNFSSVIFPDAITDGSILNSCTMQPPTFTSTTVVTTTHAGAMETPQHDNINTGALEFADSDFGQVANAEGGEIGQLNLDFCNDLTNNNDDNNNNNNNTNTNTVGEEDPYRVSCNEMIANDQPVDAPFEVHAHKEAMCQDTVFDHQEQEDALGENAFWPANIQKTNLWEWEDLLLDETYNLGGFPK